ncbi:MAG: hypothetical protein RL671_874 [Pseudomonadota bacterium]|jgi:hypothetical protein
MPTPIQNPATYIPVQALAFAQTDGNSGLVSAELPLPVCTLRPANAPLAGSAIASGQVGPFVPAAGRPVMISLAGSWSGLVKVLRSIDAGATRLPLTLAGESWGEFTANTCEPIWEEYEDGARLYLDVTLLSGSLTYRVAQ